MELLPSGLMRRDEVDLGQLGSLVGEDEAGVDDGVVAGKPEKQQQGPSPIKKLSAKIL